MFTNYPLGWIIELMVNLIIEYEYKYRFKNLKFQYLF